MSNLLSKASILLTPTAYSEGKLHSVKPIQTFGSELVTNGDFATDTDWGVNAGWSISDGKANLDTDNGTLNLTQNNVLVVGKKYRLSLIANVTVGSIKFESGEGDSFVFTGNVNSHIFIANNTSIVFRRQGVPSRGYIDNVSIVEVIDGDFDFTRATTATRVNSSGLIESVASGLPRIDFLGGTGQILLEPASTNTATYSNDFTQGNIFSGSADPSLSDAILTSNQGTAPDGTNTAQLLKDDNDGGIGQSRINYFATNVLSGEFNTASVFAKKYSNNDFFRIEVGGYDPGFPSAFFNIQNGTLGNIASGLTAKIEDYGNGWYRCSVTFQTTSDLVGSIKLCLASANGQSNVTRDGTNEVLLFGLQAEADASRNFATSYIPTSGSTVTRNKDEAINSGDSSLINLTEGVLYAEVARFSSDTSFASISISDGSTSNVIAFKFRNLANQVAGRVAGASTSKDITVTTSDISQFTKLAISYSTTDDISKFYINGVEVGTISLAGVSISGLATLQFNRGSGGEEFIGKVKTVAVFKEALTDAQLISLTS